MNKIYPYAGFWKRAIAFLIDSLVLSIPIGILMGVLLVPQVMAFIKLAASNTEPSPDAIMGFMVRYFISIALSWLVCIVGGWLYSALMESGKHQATLGKMALGIKVTGPHGERITFARATGRFFAKMISGMTLYFGFYMAGFTRYRQALHDMVATTFVVDKKQEPTAEELPALAFSKGFCITSVVVAVAPVVFYILMIVLSIALAISQAENRELPPPASTGAAVVDTVK